MSRRPDWREQAVCRRHDPEIWFPVSDHSESATVREQVDRAKRMCSACPVLAQCRAWALTAELTHGVCGGLSATERQAIRAGQPLPRPVGRPSAPTRPSNPDQPGRPYRPRADIRHGTEGGWTAHRRRGEQPCQPCLEARQACRRACREASAARKQLVRDRQSQTATDLTTAGAPA